jgi:drug/metabolite transporter, DME family
MKPASPLQGRLLIAAAAVLWSLSGFFVKILDRENPTGLGTPPVHALLLGLFRCLFAGLAMVPLLRPRDISFRPLMLLMMLSFAAMNALYMSAMALGDAATAVVLQYTAPVWIFLVSVFLLKEPAHPRDGWSIGLAMVGVAVIVALSGSVERFLIVAMALGSGVTFAAIVLCLRVLKDASPTWLTAQNHLAAGIALLPALFFIPSPTGTQLGVLAVFGVIQMAVPYVLMSRGLKTVSAQEAGMICLLEPLLIPVWAYLTAGEVPHHATLIGGGIILLSLLYRYWPTGKEEVTPS